MTTEQNQASCTADPGSTQGRSTAVIVSGAGRSGTSATTRGIQALGVDLGSKLRPAGGKNPTGFFEDQDVLALTKRLKRLLGIHGGSLRLIADSEWDSSQMQDLRAQAVTVLGKRFGGSPLWGFKHGRTLRLLSFWEPVFAQLELDVCYVIALRNPLSVAHSRAQINPERGRPAWNGLEWLVNVIPYFERLRGQRFAVVDFDSLLAEPAIQLRRVAHELALPVGVEQELAIEQYAQDFLRPGKPLSRYTLDDLDTDPRVPPLVSQAYRLLYRLAQGKLARDDPAFWQELAQIDTSVADLGPLLDEFDYMRRRQNRALWNPASPVQALGQVWRDYRSR